MKPYALKKFVEKISDQEKRFENTFKIFEDVMKMKKRSPWEPRSSKKPSETEDEKNTRDLEILFRAVKISALVLSETNLVVSLSFAYPLIFLVFVTSNFNHSTNKF